jgi:outer membrane receptor protein involved in Fe transport
MTADYTFDFGLRLGASWLHVADSYSLSRSFPTTALKLPDYDVVDLTASQFFADGRGRVYLRAENVFDENYVESFGFPQPGRLIVVGAELRL